MPAASIDDVTVSPSVSIGAECVSSPIVTMTSR
jgi:hypothetical protein